MKGPAAMVEDGRAGPGHLYDLERRRRLPSAEERTARVGMTVFLGSWAMLFVGLFFAYALVRARAPTWPPPGAPPLPRLLPALNTLAVAAASALVGRAVAAADRGLLRRAAAALGGAAALGAGFLALQGLVWARQWREGLVPSGGPYPSVFYAFTTLHALHVLVGVVALAALAVHLRWRAGASRGSVRLWGWYWHFVGALWLALYATLYLL